MKRLVFSMIACCAIAFGAFAVPRGSYYKESSYKEPELKVLVSDSGDIHILRPDGSVLHTLQVIEEHNEGDYVAFTTRDNYGITYQGNAYKNENGTVILDLKQLRYFVKRM